MSAGSVPRDIREFIARYLTSVELMEAFVVLQRNAGRSWTPGDLAGELRIGIGRAADVLERLASRNFLAVKISNDIVYRFDPANAPLAAAAERFADYYVRERVAALTMAAAISSLGPLHDFAEAFRLKKDAP